MVAGDGKGRGMKIAVAMCYAAIIIAGYTLTAVSMPGVITPTDAYWFGATLGICSFVGMDCEWRLVDLKKKDRDVAG